MTGRRLPEPGDVAAAVRIFNARIEAAVGADENSPTVWTGPTLINLAEDAMDGEGALSMRMVYGDLFEIPELMREGGASLAHRYVNEMLSGESDLFSSLVTMYLQGCGLGVLMERRRWEHREDGETEGST